MKYDLGGSYHSSIISGPCNVIVTGTVIAFEKNPIEIEFGSNTGQLKLVLEFVDDLESTKENYAQVSRMLANELRIKFLNFHNVLGSGTVRPIKIGSLDGRQLYIQYRIYELRGGDKTVHYSIYLGQEVERDD